MESPSRCEAWNGPSRRFVYHLTEQNERSQVSSVEDVMKTFAGALQGDGTMSIRLAERIMSERWQAETRAPAANQSSNGTPLNLVFLTQRHRRFGLGPVLLLHLVPFPGLRGMDEIQHVLRDQAQFLVVIRGFTTAVASPQVGAGCGIGQRRHILRAAAQRIPQQACLDGCFKVLFARVHAARRQSPPWDTNFVRRRQLTLLQLLRRQAAAELPQFLGLHVAGGSGDDVASGSISRRWFFTQSWRVRSWPSLVGLWSACSGWQRAAFVAVTNSQSNNSSHGPFTPLLEIPFDLLERADALALEMALARDGIHRRSGETVLNL